MINLTGVLLYNEKWEEEKTHLIKSARRGTRTLTSIRTHGPQPCLSTNFSTRAGYRMQRCILILNYGKKRQNFFNEMT